MLLKRDAVQLAVASQLYLTDEGVSVGISIDWHSNVCDSMFYNICEPGGKNRCDVN